MTEAHKPSRQAHSPRRLARVFALLGVYEWIANPELSAEKIEQGLRALIEEEDGVEDWSRADRELLATLLSGVVCEHAAIEAAFAPFVDRDLKRVSLVERSILFLGTFELMRAPETPYRVVLNEAIELAKRFGSGYRFTNAVLERVAEKVRETEFKADHAEKSQKDGN